MAKGNVDPATVTKIIASTKMANDKDWEDAIKRYKRDYWTGYRAQAERLARKFLKEGKVVQPRLTEGRHPFTEKTGIWVEREEDIAYIPDPPSFERGEDSNLFRTRIH